MCTATYTDATRTNTHSHAQTHTESACTHTQTQCIFTHTHTHDARASSVHERQGANSPVDLPESAALGLVRSLHPDRGEQLRSRTYVQACEQAHAMPIGIECARVSTGSRRVRNSNNTRRAAEAAVVFVVNMPELPPQELPCRDVQGQVKARGSRHGMLAWPHEDAAHGPATVPLQGGG